MPVFRKRVSAVVDEETYRGIQAVREKYGFLNESDAVRFIIKHGLDVLLEKKAEVIQ